MASDSQESRGRKPRNYYVDYTQNKFRERRRGMTSGTNNSRYRDTPDVSFGDRGFLITSVDEVKSYLEMRNIFEEYFEQLYTTEADHKAGDGHDLTTEDQVDLELEQLRKRKPFKQVKTHCRNTLFLNITKQFSYVDPVKLVDKFFDELIEKREIRTSNTFKVLPILDTFRNSSSCAKDSVANILKTIFKEELGEKRYFIEFQSRGNYKLNPDEKQKMIEVVAETVSELKPEWSVDRESADFIIVLVSLRNVCCISIVKSYFKRMKYNVLELCKEFGPQPAQVDTTEDPHAEDVNKT